MSQPPTQAADLFFSYSHEDESFRVELEKHLSMLKRQGWIRPWHDRKIDAGQEWAGEIDEHLERADIVLLLVSASFLSSDYCYDVEMTRALERHEDGEAVVVPVILRPCDWMSAPFAKLQGLPKDARPISDWEDADTAMLDVAKGLRRLLSQPSENPAAKNRLTKALDRAYFERAETLAEGGDVSELNETIVSLKRELRAGPQLQAGDFLLEDRLKLLKVIGKGGFATVWKAYDRSKRSLVAVKVLHSQYSDNSTRRDRFFRGARKMASLRHPNIVRVVEEHCEDGGYHFFVMEYVPGLDFRKAVLGDALNIAERLRVILRVADALAEAHSQGIVHRDVKPANILLDAQNNPRLTDFDLVQAADSTGGTRTSMLGTILYAAPEAMLDAKQAGEPADVYGLGMTALFALHGQDLPPQALWDLPSFVDSLQGSHACCDYLARAVMREVSERLPTMNALSSGLREILEADGTLSGDEQITLESDSRLRIFTLLGAADIPIRQRLDIAETLGREGDPRLRPGMLEANFLGVPGQSWSLGKYPVTVEEYQRFVDAGGYNDSRWWSEGWTGISKQPGRWEQQLGTPNRPVIYVSWWEATAYCLWLSELHGKRFRLPSQDKEWGLAAAHPEGQYPWGDQAPDKERCNFGQNVGHPTPVGLYPYGNGRHGHCDLAGNVWEWCIESIDDGQRRPLQGSAWFASAESLPSKIRSSLEPNGRLGSLGFRLLWAPEV